MKITKTASGKPTIKISKKEWQSIGKKAGWMKIAQVSRYIDFSEEDSRDDSISEMKIVAPDTEYDLSNPSLYLSEVLKNIDIFNQDELNVCNEIETAIRNKDIDKMKKYYFDHYSTGSVVNISDLISGLKTVCSNIRNDINRLDLGQYSSPANWEILMANENSIKAKAKYYSYGGEIDGNDVVLTLSWS